MAARCWVCHRSSTSCGTCRHFRGSVAANVGYCGRVRDRHPLRGDEIRGCWEEPPMLIQLDDGVEPLAVAGAPLTEPAIGLFADLDG